MIDCLFSKRLLEFGRFAEGNRKERGEGKPKSFDFLGFTHICSRRRSDNGFKLRRKTISKRQRKKLKSIKEVLKKNYHERPMKVGKWLKAVVQGYFNYHAIPGNMEVLDSFRTAIIGMWIKAMRREVKGINPFLGGSSQGSLTASYRRLVSFTCTRINACVFDSM